MNIPYAAPDELKLLIGKAEAGNVAEARDGLRAFTTRRPGVLLAWKWLADLAENPRERQDAIRRARLLAPGDPWLTAAEKQKMPPQKVPNKPQSDQLPYSTIGGTQPLVADRPTVIEPLLYGNGNGNTRPFGSQQGRETVTMPYRVVTMPTSSDSVLVSEPNVSLHATAPLIARSAAATNDVTFANPPAPATSDLAPSRLSGDVLTKTGSITPKQAPTLPTDPTPAIPTLTPVSHPHVLQVLQSANLLPGAAPKEDSNPFSMLTRPLQILRESSTAAMEAMTERTQPLRTASITVHRGILALILVTTFAGIGMVLTALALAGIL